MKISATYIRQNSAILQQALKEDIVVTKRDKPFVVIIEYDKYHRMEEELQRLKEGDMAEKMRRSWLQSANESESVMTQEDDALYQAINLEAAERMGEE